MIKIPATLTGLLCALAFIAAPAAATAAAPETSVYPLEDAIWVWSDAPGGDTIQLSEQRGMVWGEPVALSSNQYVNVVPAAVRAADGTLLAVWSTFVGSQSELRYRIRKGGVWGDELRYYSGLASNTAPTVAIDAAGTVWIAWAGFNGLNDEIYYTTFDGATFATATPLTSNDVPDILPVLGVDSASGHPYLQWNRYAGNAYVTVEASWDGSAWSTPVELSAGTPQAQSAQKLTTGMQLATPAGGVARAAQEPAAGEVIVELPDFVSAPESASIHIPGYEVQSLPVRNMSIVVE